MPSDASKILSRADRLLQAPMSTRRADFRRAVEASNNAAAARGAYQSGPQYRVLRTLCEQELAARVDLLLTCAEDAHRAMDGSVDEAAQRAAKEWLSAHLKEHEADLEQVLKKHPASSLKNVAKRQSLAAITHAHVESGYARIDQYFDSARQSDRRRLMGVAKRWLAKVGALLMARVS